MPKQAVGQYECLLIVASNINLVTNACHVKHATKLSACNVKVEATANNLTYTKI